MSRYLEVKSNEYFGVYNPPRDGDCLMQCAVTHDFGQGSGGGVAIKARTANDLRTLVVARVRCNLLAAFGRQSRSVDGRGGGVACVGGAGMVSVEAYCEAMS